MHNLVQNVRELLLTFIQKSDLPVAARNETLHGCDVVLAESVPRAEVCRQRAWDVDRRMIRRQLVRGPLGRVVINRNRTPGQVLFISRETDAFEAVPGAFRGFRSE